MFPLVGKKLNINKLYTFKNVIFMRFKIIL